uniref:FBA_2 domain-containing protein n=1 Tax=Caenorhabditis tropicalis TaxID=1561998 RepID=A0A1I7TZ91_9PELO
MSYQLVQTSSNDGQEVFDFVSKVVDLAHSGKLSDYEAEKLSAEYSEHGNSPAVYDLSLGEGISRITVLIGTAKQDFSFVSEEFFKFQESNTMTKIKQVYGVVNATEVSVACAILERLLGVFPGKIGTITLDQFVFASVDKYFELTEFVNKITKCDNLRIHGHGENNAFASTELLNQLLILKEITIRESPIDGSLNAQMISAVPSTEFNLLSATPEQIMSYSSKYSVFNLPKFSINDVNQLIRHWLKSNITHISTLILKIENAENENIENFFNGLTLIEGLKQPCCGFGSKCSNAAECSNRKLGHLQCTGIKIIRKSDNSEAIIFYSVHLNEFNFVMLVNHASGMEQERFSAFEAAFKDKLVFYIESGQKKKAMELMSMIQVNEKRLTKKIDEKEKLSVELALMMDKLSKSDYDWEDYIIQRLSENCKRIEQLAYQSFEKRENYGHFELEEEGFEE